jgi:hypothetical protein
MERNARNVSRAAAVVAAAAEQIPAVAAGRRPVRRAAGLCQEVAAVRLAIH